MFAFRQFLGGFRAQLQRRAGKNGGPRLTSKLSVVALGQIVAGVLGLAATPLLAGIYGASAFGIYALFITALTCLGSVCTFRIEQAIPIAKTRRVAGNLALLAIGSSIVTSVAVAVVGFAITNKLEVSWAWGLAICLPPAIASYACYQVVGMWVIRQQAYVVLSAMRVTSVTGCLVIQLLMPFFIPASPTMLACGQIAGQFLAVATGACLLRSSWPTLRFETLATLRRQLARFGSLPRYDLAAQLLSQLAIQGPVLLIYLGFGEAAAGVYALAQRLLATPLTFVSSAFSQVFFSEAARIATDRDKLRALLSQMLAKSALFVVPFTIVSIACAPWLQMIFGPEWDSIGVVTALLAPVCAAYVLAFIVTSIFVVTGTQSTRLVREAFCVISLVVGFLVGYLAGLSVVPTIATMCCGGVIGYSFAIYLSWKVVPRRPVELIIDSSQKLSPAA